MKRLIVNADDFGFTRGVNKGILRGHTEGIITAATLMAGGAAFEHAVEIARSTPSLDVGVHLVLWPGGQELPRRLPSFVRRSLVWSPGRVEDEFARQIEKVTVVGITPTHLDTHKHVHLLPWVMSAVVRVAKRFGIEWVRRPLLRRQVTRKGLRTPDHFVGVWMTGRLNQDNLIETLLDLRPGVTELMCHPGLCDADLRRAPTRLREEREVELSALTSREARKVIDRMKVELTSYRAINQGRNTLAAVAIRP